MDLPDGDGSSLSYRLPRDIKMQSPYCRDEKHQCMKIFQLNMHGYMRVRQ